MRDDQEKQTHGRAVIRGHVGGAKLAWQIDNLCTVLAGDNGRPPRARAEAWPSALVEAIADVDSLAERNAMQESTINRLEGLKRTAQSEAERAKQAQRKAESDHAAALESALLFGAEADELRAVLEPMAEVLAALPLATLASTGDAGRLAALYLRAELVTAETPAERYARLGNKLANPESDNANSSF